MQPSTIESGQERAVEDMDFGACSLVQSGISDKPEQFRPYSDAMNINKQKQLLPTRTVSVHSSRNGV